MSVLGIDIGTSYCVLATIQKGAITIVRNELSERLTPALVGFTEKERLIGEAASVQMKSNARNTCRNIKQLLGMTEADAVDVNREREYALAPIVFTDAKEGAVAGFDVNYKGESRVFSATRCMAALLSNLKETAQKSIGSSNPITDVVISVPAWSSDKARHAIVDAAKIAGLNCLRCLNEHAAVALDYGIYRSSTFDPQTPSIVTFVGVGHGATNVSVVAFTRGQLKVLGVSSNKQLGGRDIDFIIVKHFAAKFQQKYGLDPLKNPKALLKLEDAATRAKKILSANSEAPFNVECLMEEYDLAGVLTRQDLEELCLPFRTRFIQQLEKTFVDNDLKKEDVHNIEIVGGCIRTPWMQEAILSFFENRLPLSKTLNMDETVARGCALQAAMLYPGFKVREFNVNDSLFEPVKVDFPSPSSETGRKAQTLFDRGAALGSVKALTFGRAEPFELLLSAGPTVEPLVTQVEMPAEVEMPWPKKVKVAAKLNLNGTVGWESANLCVEEEIEEMVKEPKPEVEGVAAGTDDAEVLVPKKKIKTRKFECKLRSAPRLGYLEPSVRQILREEEVSMQMDDYLQKEVRDTKNDLEAFIFKMRDALQDQFRDFASEAEKSKMLPGLQAAEDWLYDNFEGTKDCYVAKFSELKALCGDVEMRFLESQARADAVQDLTSLISELRAYETSPSWAHVESEKMTSLMVKCNEIERWLNELVSAHAAAPQHQNPTVMAKVIDDERESLAGFSRTILVEKVVVPTVEEKHVEEDVPMDSPEPTTAEATGDASDIPMNS